MTSQGNKIEEQENKLQTNKVHAIGRGFGWTLNLTKKTEKVFLDVVWNLVSLSLYLFISLFIYLFIFVQTNLCALCSVLNFGYHSFLLHKCECFIIYWHCFRYLWNIFSLRFKCYQVLDLLEITKDITFLPFFITITISKSKQSNVFTKQTSTSLIVYVVFIFNCYSNQFLLKKNTKYISCFFKQVRLVWFREKEEYANMSIFLMPISFSPWKTDN